jgi:hypothetical protein
MTNYNIPFRPIKTEEEIKQILEKRSNNNWYENTINATKIRSEKTEWQESNKQRWQDSVWKKAHDDKVKKTMQTDDYKINHLIGIAKRTADPAWNEANRRSKFKPIVTPYGIFNSLDSASNEIYLNNFWPNRKTVISVKGLIRSKLKINPKEFYYITKEEYQRLTGKEI